MLWKFKLASQNLYLAWVKCDCRWKTPNWYQKLDFAGKQLFFNFYELKTFSNHDPFFEIGLLLWSFTKWKYNRYLWKYSVKKTKTLVNISDDRYLNHIFIWNLAVLVLHVEISSKDKYNIRYPWMSHRDRFE